MAVRVEKAMAEGGELAVINLLNANQIKYVEEYVKDFNGIGALKRAGYKVTGDNGGRLFKNMQDNPAVRIAVAYYTKLRAEKSTVSSQFVIAKWVKLIESYEESSKKDPKAAAVLLRTTELLGKALGMFVDRTEITGKDGEAIKIEETNDAAADFTRQIARLAAREREDGSPLQTGRED